MLQGNWYVNTLLRNSYAYGINNIYHLYSQGRYCWPVRIPLPSAVKQKI